MTSGEPYTELQNISLCFTSDGRPSRGPTTEQLRTRFLMTIKEQNTTKQGKTSSVQLLKHGTDKKVQTNRVSTGADVQSKSLELNHSYTGQQANTRARLHVTLSMLQLLSSSMLPVHITALPCSNWCHTFTSTKNTHSQQDTRFHSSAQTQELLVLEAKARAI